ncbi:hypothetical protein VP01_3997g2 [Puccinia sorghi]|uniref:Tc1-like transposase DDE domain-containing protein n=1 Tax=Puccinia sorghi TaxID=27349 RepID=A0A0L6US41_9BASI|nr:hypothetical protein VP01_3997g2 [Puccinia sorghi]
MSPPFHTSGMRQHDYVLNRVTNIGQKLIFIDESGFNSQNHPSHGYSLTDQFFLSFSIVCCFVENKRKTEYDQPYHWHAESIIVMDNAWIHGGDNLERVWNLLKEASKKIEIEFLPKYLLFLNPINLAFNIIKIYQNDSGNMFQVIFALSKVFLKFLSYAANHWQYYQ